MEVSIFKPAIAAVDNFNRSHDSNLTSSQRQTLQEVKRRLERLDTQFDKLRVINDKLMQKDEIKTYFDQENDTYVISVGGKEIKVQLKRANPNVPIAMTNLTKGSAYDAGDADQLDTEQNKLRMELESELESYYQCAHKILKLFGTIPELDKIKCSPVTIVRNYLIEHAKTGSTYTFGVGSTGPRVKPMHRGEMVFNDEGLLPNTEEFIEAIVSGCKLTQGRK